MRETMSEALAAVMPAVEWEPGVTVLNLRGAPESETFRHAVLSATGVALPTLPCTTSSTGALQIVWAGPDDWFVVAPPGSAVRLEAKLRSALEGVTFSVTDVSSGYGVLRLQGARARALLAQGCPLDLHPSVFRLGMSAGSHYFKASVWLWMVDETPTFKVLVRSSFRPYVKELLHRTARFVADVPDLHP